MSSHSAVEADWSKRAEHFCRYARRMLEQDAIEDVPDEVVQRFLTMALKLYVRKRESGYVIAPFGDRDEVTPTEAVKAVVDMLEAVEVEIFELGLWKSFGR